MNRLSILRDQLATLLRQRRVVRWVSAYSALFSSALWTLAAIFVLDVIFQMSPMQRIVVFALAGVALVWAFTRYTWPLLGIRETIEEMALMVERQQRIDSDLVAALQFESVEAAGWGSPQLANAVIGYVGQLGHGLNVFEGFTRKSMTRRCAILCVSAALLGSLALTNLDYTRVFFNRLLLGSRHYPTDTVIDQVMVNGALVLDFDDDSHTPRAVRCAEGKPLNFSVICSGRTPNIGRVQFTTSAEQRSGEVQLNKLSLRGRCARLSEALSEISSALEQTDIVITNSWIMEIAALVRFDAPRVVKLLDSSSGERSALTQAASEVEKVLQSWPNTARKGNVYLGQLNRLTGDARYHLLLGDAATHQGAISMIPLPAVELLLSSTPPEYAAAAEPDLIEPGTLQIAALEGSRVDVELKCVNGKELRAVWMICRQNQETETLPLKKLDPRGLRWRLSVAGTPLEQLQRETRIELQVTDGDGLSLSAPIQALIRIKADLRPSVTASVDYRAALPEGTPTLRVRLADDYGVESLSAHVQIIRHSDEEDIPQEPEERSLPIESLMPLGSDGSIIADAQPNQFPLPIDQLPLIGGYQLRLSSLDLAKGDRVNITFVAIDSRGDRPGKSTRSEVVSLEITDVSGVLAALSELDGHSEREMTEIINRQKMLLGIGDSP